MTGTDDDEQGTEHGGAKDAPAVTPEIVRRKSDHMDICLRDDILNRTNYWDDVQLIHQALPGVDLEAISTSTELFGARLGAPIVIASMTGGHAHGADINANLAAAAAELHIPLGVGSQRPALEHPDYAVSFSSVKDYDIPLVIANIGAPQLIDQGNGRTIGVEQVRQAMDMIDADMVAVHLNFLQEIAQPEGDTRAAGIIEAIAELAAEVPVIAKETGAGISNSVALELLEAGVVGIDVGGAGGTSFAAVEAVRAEERGMGSRARIGWTFRDWGIPTPVSVVEAGVGLPVIATGGIRTGLDAARALVLGASAAGVARGVLPAALKGPAETIEELTTIIAELRAAMFLVGAADLSELPGQGFILSDRLLAWLARFEGDEDE